MTTNIFLLNGAETSEYAGGEYNQALSEVAKEFFTTRGDTFKSTRIFDGYDRDTEIENLLWADVVIFQFPIYWFLPPSTMKAYIDDVYMEGYDKLCTGDGLAEGGNYGSGGLLQDKKYLLSTTWDAPIEAFGDTNQLFRGGTPDDVLLPLHLTQEFIGFSALPSFSCHNVPNYPDMDRDSKRLLEHLKNVFDGK